jgi:hypothetical protein
MQFAQTVLAGLKPQAGAATSDSQLRVSGVCGPEQLLGTVEAAPVCSE